MRIVTAEEIRQALTYPALIAALETAFRGEVTVPVRHHHTLPQAGSDATLLLMPAWNADGDRFIGCKIVTVFPDNAARNEPSVYGSYFLLSGGTGEPLAVMDGRELTARRTASASALAARHLAREDAAHLVMIGAGALAAHLVRACERAADQTRDLVESHSRAWPSAGRRTGRGWLRPSNRDRTRNRGARGRHRLLRNAFRRAAGRGRMA